MKSLDPALQAHLDDGTTTLAWCWRIARADGVTFGFTDHDRTLSFDGTDFEPESGLTASEVRSGSDLSVDAQDAEGVLTSDRITETDSGVEDVSDIPRVLRRLVDIGECEEVYVGHKLYLAPTTPRWISVGEGVSAFLGVSEPPDGLSLVDSDNHDIVRRLRVGTDDEVAILELAGVQEVSLSEWLVPPGYLRHASRRMRQPARSDAVTLGRFWDLLEEALTEEGLTVSADAEVRFLGGRPGDFFGRHNSAQPEGRWTTDPGEGLWCAYRRGYGDTHWHPCIVAVAGDGQRALDLYDEDEWRWAVLARGRRVGAEEVVRADGLRIQLTFPAPVQLRAAMDILGSPSGAWAWDVSPKGPDLWRLLT